MTSITGLTATLHTQNVEINSNKQITRADDLIGAMNEWYMKYHDEVVTN